MNIEFPIVIPSHKSVLTPSEYKRVAITLRFNQNNCFFMLPDSIVREFCQNYSFVENVITFEDHWFRSVRTYSSLLLNNLFWSKLSRFENILICHVDAILIKDAQDLRKFSFPFIGPRLHPTKCRLFNGKIYENYRKHFFLPSRLVEIGGGGISIRNVNQAREMIMKAKNIRNSSRLFSGEVMKILYLGISSKNMVTKSRIPAWWIVYFWKFFQEA